MTYQLRFSDVNNTGTVTVPAMPPGINNVDTSLNLVGRGYPNYGEKYAENFLHLLENFASPVPPENPIEGQLWYDTSDKNRKVLRIMDGTASAARWPLATGIYQQSSDPKLSPVSGLKNGDLWVDTSSNTLKLYYSNNWTLVGPSSSSGSDKSGLTIDDLVDTDTNSHKVAKLWSEGTLVAVISADEEFTPNPVITGFATIKPGINLTTISGFKFLGTADDSDKLGGEDASSYLLKDDSGGQIITGKVIYESPDLPNPQERDGLIIRTSGQPTSEFIQIYKDSYDAVIYNNKSTGKIDFQIQGALTSRLSIQKDLITINTSTTLNGSLTVSNTVTSNNLSLTQHASIGGNTAITGNLKVTGITTTTGVLYVNQVRATTSTNSIGTKSIPFESIHATNVYARNYLSEVGTLRLWAGSTATSTLPEGWRYCTGTSLSTASYSDLYTVIGTYYGGSGGSFNIPNLYVTLGGVTSYYIIKVE